MKTNYVNIYREEVGDTIYESYQGSEFSKECVSEYGEEYIKFVTVSPDTINPIEGVKRFASDRQIDKMDYNHLNLSTNVLEELLEGLGGTVPKENRPALVDAVSSFLEDCMQSRDIVSERKEVCLHEQIDFLQDIQVFCMTETMKLGIDPTLALIETTKEINSRLQDPFQKKDWDSNGVSGKFQKWIDQPKDTLYTADFTRSNNA